MTEQDRYRGALLGLACGDALGTTVEFQPRGSFEPLTDIVGGGPFNLRAGEWTDDTSMALCLAHSLVYRGGFDPVDQMNRYCNWYNVGYMSSTGDCFDIGMTVASALRKYMQDQNPFAGSMDLYAAGNGALMRLAPIPMFYALSERNTFHYSGESTRTTHGAQEAIECSRLFGLQIRAALLGSTKKEILRVQTLEPLSTKVEGLASGSYLSKDELQIRGSGYSVESLEAALWCFHHTDSFEEAVLRAANLGDDADTTAAICGQLAGAYYGQKAIPQRWLDKIVMYEDISDLADNLLEYRQPV